MVLSFSRTRRACRTGYPGRARSRVRPAVEALEDRTTPSTFTVTSLTDSGPGSLRQAILDANANPGADRIVFAPRVRGTIVLTDGPLSIADDLTIDGPGAPQLAVSGSDASRVFSITGGVTATLADLTVTHGLADEGAGVWNAGNLTISQSVLSSNQAVNATAGGIGRGGGIFNAAGATLAIDHSTLTANLATGDGKGQGGGLLNKGQASVSHTTFTDNRAVGGTAGTFISSSGQGGAIRNEDGATLAVDHSTFLNNQAFGGPGIAGAGGAIYNYHATADVSRSTFTGNQAVGGDGYSGDGPPVAGFGLGGAIINNGENGVVSALTVSHSTFANNQARGGNGGADVGGGNGVGGALWNNETAATLTVEHSACTGNLAQGGQRGVAGFGIINGNGLGGAIANGFGASLVVRDSQLSGNQALGGGGADGISGGDGLGGGLVNLFDGSATLDQSQLTDNLAEGGAGGAGANGGNGQGGGIFNGFNDAAVTVLTLTADAITGNHAVGGAGSSGAADGLGQGGGLYDQEGSVAFVDARTRIRGNRATTSDDDTSGTVTPI
jgi:hypothetical protein